MRRSAGCPTWPRHVTSAACCPEWSPVCLRPRDWLRATGGVQGQKRTWGWQVEGVYTASADSTTWVRHNSSPSPRQPQLLSGAHVWVATSTKRRRHSSSISAPVRLPGKSDNHSPMLITRRRLSARAASPSYLTKQGVVMDNERFTEGSESEVCTWTVQVSAATTCNHSLTKWTIWAPRTGNGLCQEEQLS